MNEAKRKLKLTPWYRGVNPMRSRPGDYLWLNKGLWYWSGEFWYDKKGSWKCFCQTPVWKGVAR